MRRRYNWISGYADLAARRGYGRTHTLLQHIVFDTPRLARHYLVGVPSLFYHRRIKERARYFFVGIPSLFYRRKVKLVVGYVELAARRSYGHVLGYVELAARRSYGHVLGYVELAARRSYGHVLGYVELAARRSYGHVLGYVELAARRSYGYTKVVLWHILIGLPRRAYQSISKRGGISGSAIKQAPHKPVG